MGNMQVQGELCELRDASVISKQEHRGYKNEKVGNFGSNRCRGFVEHR